MYYWHVTNFHFVFISSIQITLFHCYYFSLETKHFFHHAIYFCHWPCLCHPFQIQVSFHKDAQSLSIASMGQTFCDTQHMGLNTTDLRVYRLSDNTPLPVGRYLQMIGFRCLPAGAHWKSMQMRPFCLAEDINLQEPCRHRCILGPQQCTS